MIPQLPINPALRNLPVYQPGRPIEEVARELGIPAGNIIKVASNENPLGPSPAALAAMQHALANINLYPDGNAFYLKRALAKKLSVKTAKELNGATICVAPGTTTELNLADYFRANKMEFKPVVIEKVDEIYAAFFSGRCDVMTGDASALAAQRTGRASNPDDYMILTERISKEPLAPLVRHGDEQWHDVVDWVVYALIEAEERGITQKNVDDMLKSDDPGIKRMLGVTPGLGKALGLDEKWAYNAIKGVGNYGEIFDKHLGLNSPLKLERGYNNLWTKGGLIYAPPIR